jgi:membrane fusion protein (multidrug efflux system)
MLAASCSKQGAPSHGAMPTEVTVIKVHRKDIPVNFELVGEAQSSHPVDIFPRVAGYLRKIHFVEGAFVNEGDPLFDLDQEQFDVVVKEAQADLDRANALLLSAQKTLERFQPLFEEKAASQKDLDDAITQVVSQQADVSSYKAKLEEAYLNLSYTKITSPISGLSAKAKYREGTLISPSSSGNLTSIYILDPIWVYINISDSAFLQISQESALGEISIPNDWKFDVTLSLADGTKFPYQGKIDFISPLLDAATGTLSARATFPNPQYLVKPGQFVKVTVLGAYRRNAIQIPQKAIMQGNSGQFVYVLKNNHAERRPIVTGDWNGGNWFVREGLEEGDVVIVDGIMKITNGTEVLVKKID